MIRLIFLEIFEKYDYFIQFHKWTHGEAHASYTCNGALQKLHKCLWILHCATN